METKPIQVKHDDVLITYHEADNAWKFTLRGRDRSAESLAKAKEFIDRPVSAEKAKPFQKIPAWFLHYNSLPAKVDVTGIAEGRGWRGENEVWISNKGKRSKEYIGEVRPANPKNDALIAKIIAKREEREKLYEEINQLESELDPLVLPKDE